MRHFYKNHCYPVNGCKNCFVEQNIHIFIGNLTLNSNLWIFFAKNDLQLLKIDKNHLKIHKNH